MNKDQVKGRITKAAGKVKEVAGKAIGNKELERRGKGEQAKGRLHSGFGDVKSDLGKLQK